MKCLAILWPSSYCVSLRPEGTITSNVILRQNHLVYTSQFPPCACLSCLKCPFELIPLSCLTTANRRPPKYSHTLVISKPWNLLLALMAQFYQEDIVQQVNAPHNYGLIHVCSRVWFSSQSLMQPLISDVGTMQRMSQMVLYLIL